LEAPIASDYVAVILKLKWVLLEKLLSRLDRRCPGGIIRFDFGTSAACLVAGRYRKFRLPDETWRRASCGKLEFPLSAPYIKRVPFSG
jgi:hypothetical protein